MKGNIRTTAVVIAALALTGCNVADVKQARPNDNLGLLCIVHNPAVKVDDFVDVLQEGFARHSLNSKVITSQAGPECGSTVTYTARRSWDFTTYLALATVDIWQQGQKMASLHYEHNNGFSLVKWQGTKAKMDPLIDQMLATATASGSTAPTAAEASAPADQLQPSMSQPTNAAAQPAAAQSNCKACASIGKNL